MCVFGIKQLFCCARVLEMLPADFEPINERTQAYEKEKEKFHRFDTWIDEDRTRMRLLEEAAQGADPTLREYIDRCIIHMLTDNRMLSDPHPQRWTPARAEIDQRVQSFHEIRQHPPFRGRAPTDGRYPQNPYPRPISERPPEYTDIRGNTALFKGWKL